MEFELSKRRHSVRSYPEKEGWLVLYKNRLIREKLYCSGFVPFLITHFTTTFIASY